MDLPPVVTSVVKATLQEFTDGELEELQDQVERELQARERASGVRLRRYVRSAGPDGDVPVCCGACGQLRHPGVRCV